MFVNNLDPVAFEFLSFQIRWYSLAYIFGFLIGWFYIKNFLIKDLREKTLVDDFITYLILGVIIGGRLGYVVFYNFFYYLSHPLEIFFIWQGGMSFHGGLIGVIWATYLFCKRNKIQIFATLDVIACVAPIGLFFGRIANFINGELYGKITSIYWGVIFPKIDGFTRHPSQLYEAILEGLLLFIILNKIIMKKNYVVGTCSYMFLILYGSFRIFAEIFREPDLQIGYLFDILSMGSFLSILMIVIGIILSYLKKNENKY